MIVTAEQNSESYRTGVAVRNALGACNSFINLSFKAQLYYLIPVYLKFLLRNGKRVSQIVYNNLNDR